MLSSFLFYSWNKERKKRIQAQQTTINIATLKDSVKTYLVLTTAQIKEIFPEMEKRLKEEFDQKLKNVLSIANSKIITNNTFHTFVKDSINIKLDTILFKYIAYKDSFTDFEASEIDKDFYVTRNITTVPITEINYREPWTLKFILPWNWGKRKELHDIRSSNPHAVIKYSQFIEIQK
jgi:hypothetical protein